MPVRAAQKAVACLLPSSLSVSVSALLARLCFQQARELIVIIVVVIIVAVIVVKVKVTIIIIIIIIIIVTTIVGIEARHGPPSLPRGGQVGGGRRVVPRELARRSCASEPPRQKNSLNNYGIIKQTLVSSENPCSV